MTNLSDIQRFYALRYAASTLFEQYEVDVLRAWYDKRISTLNFMTHPNTVIRDMFDFSDPFEVADELNRQTDMALEFYLSMNILEELDKPTDQTGQ
jgi:hypothetical protein